MIVNFLQHAPEFQPHRAMQVWTILFQRLQAAKTARFVRGFLVFLSHFVVKHGPMALQASTDTLQLGIFLMVLQQARRPSSELLSREPAMSDHHSPGHGGAVTRGFACALDGRRFESLGLVEVGMMPSMGKGPEACSAN